MADSELERVRDGFESRRNEYLRGYLEEPPYNIDEGLGACQQELKSAEWVWGPDETGATLAPVGERYFRRSFALPADRKVESAYCAFVADNYADLIINEIPLGRANGFHQAKSINITRHLRTGRNVFALTAYNVGDTPNPAGILGVIHITFERGEPLLLTTDEGWLVTDSIAQGWDGLEIGEIPWVQAESLGKAGSAPWGQPSIRLEGEVIQYAFSRLTFALAALQLNTQTDRANSRIVEAVKRIQEEKQSVGEFGLHWMGGMFYRIYGMFGPSGSSERRLNEDAAEAIWGLFADWARSESRVSDADPDHTWRIWGSENHSAQRDATAWASARMIAAHPSGESFRYDDDTYAAEHLAAWETYLKEYFRERIKRGMLIEISPSGYGSRTLQGWHNIYDFSDDPELRYLVKSALDLWWAEWAQEQLGGIRGGGKTRLYPGGALGLSGNDRNRAMSWFYLGEGRPAHKHETLPVIATTGYRLPLVVMDMALDPTGRGVYECRSRRLGRYLDYEESQSLSKPDEPVYGVDPEYGGIVRYSYCTPDFIIGTLMLENRPKEYWTGISQQNRWHGVLFGGGEDSTLFPQCETDRSTYNEQWSIQNKGTLIAQKLRTSDHARDMRVCFSKDLERHEEGGWVFARAARAFAAVKIVTGGWRWDDNIWLRCEDEYTPIIIEVVRSQDYSDFESFKMAILRQEVLFEGGVLRYRGNGDSGEFTFFADSDRTPELNGKPIDFSPDYAFQSPFLNEEWASGRVSISKGELEYVIDVRKDGSHDE